MLDPALLDKALSGGGKDAEDGRLSALESAMANDPIGGADLARSALEKGVTDVRVITAYALGLFAEQGPQALAPIFTSLRKAVAERWSALRPAERKERTVDGAYSTLFRTIVQHIDVHEKMKDATFRQWSRADHDAVGGPALLASAALREAITQVLPAPRSTDALSELEARVRTHFDRIAAPARPAPRPEPPADIAPEAPEAPEDDPAPASETVPARVSPWRAPDISAPSGTLRISPAFAHLLRKLEAFSLLVESGQYPKAAVVADDLRRTLKSFDPKVFFPDVFVPYFQALSSHIDEIAPCWEEMGSPRWEALEQLYQVDLDAFVDG
ncbi:type VI secretion system protein IglI family protein [Sorangium sp. So ce281]|uniref:type VI secretion system protein IglI family protein n=1 Tax=unclassified Sorangium TaxID=2621164 RepID=UPI003F63A8D5